jgi:N6-L-threonylcarbamoyladenine synthase
MHFTKANIDKEQLSAIAFTQGPGLMGHFWWEVLAKSMALALSIPVSVNHMQAHILAHFMMKRI